MAGPPIQINLKGDSMINSNHLACEDSLGGELNPEILLHNVKSNLITELGDGDKIAHLLPLANPPLSLPSDHSTIDAMPYFGRPLLANPLARTEKSCHGRANSSDSATMCSSHHH
jgi:hypothetical protein